jgi:succinate-semialdehyde dehydrogenase/glutarate-semialdehyde dehydrogenase
MSTQIAPAEQALLDSIPTGLFIGGEWTDAETGGTFDVQDPATGAVIRTIADATPADGMRALDAAVAAQDSWAATAPRTRSATSCAAPSTWCRSARRTSRC